MPAYFKCICNNCEQSIEYPQEMVNEAINCPGCQTPLTLPEQAVEKPREGFFAALAQKYQDYRQQAANRSEFRRELLQVVGDGVLTDDEIRMLVDQKSAFGLTDAEIEEWGFEVFQAALKGALASGHISPQKEAELRKIQMYLRLPDSKISQLGSQIFHSRRLFDLQQGILPCIQVPGIVLARGETAHCYQPGTLYEERIVGQNYHGISSGFTFRISKSVQYRLGSERGAMTTETAILPVSQGALIVTSQRIIFQGNAKSFATNLENILEITPYYDGIRFSESNSERPHFIGYAGNDGGYLMEVLAAAIRSRM